MPPRPLVGVHAIALRVFPGADRRVEATQLLQGPIVVRRIGGPLRDQHRGEGFADPGALGGVVVDKDHVLQAQVELGSQTDYMRCLVAPIDAPARKIGPTQDHFGMAIDRGHRHLFRILAGDGQQHPAALQRLERALKIEKGLASAIVAAQQ